MSKHPIQTGLEKLHSSLKEKDAEIARLEAEVEMLRKDQRDAVEIVHNTTAKNICLEARVKELEDKSSRSRIQKDRDYWHKKAMDMLQCPQHPLTIVSRQLAEAQGRIERAIAFIDKTHQGTFNRGSKLKQILQGKE